MKRRIISAAVAGVMTLGVGGFAYAGNQGVTEEMNHRIFVAESEEKADASMEETEVSDEQEESGMDVGEALESSEQTEESEEKGSDKKDKKDKKESKEAEKSEKTTKGSADKRTSDRENSSSSSSDSNRPASRPSGNSGNSSSGSTGKPNNTPSSKPNDKPSGGSGQSENKPSKPPHTHSWTAQTTVVRHPATGHNEQVLVKEAWMEYKPIYETVAINICNGCNADITGNESSHNKSHAVAGEPGGWHTEYIQKQTGTETISHPAEYETRWVQDSAAWDETVVTGYTCSCGATK